MDGREKNLLACSSHHQCFDLAYAFHRFQLLLKHIKQARFILWKLYLNQEGLKTVCDQLLSITVRFGVSRNITFQPPFHVREIVHYVCRENLVRYNNKTRLPILR